MSQTDNTEPNRTNRDSGSRNPSLRELALAHLSAPSQRQSMEALADMQALPDDHPIWSIIGMLAATISASSVDKNSPSGLENTLTVLQKTLAEIQGELQSLELEQQALASEVSALHTGLDTHLAEIAKVIAGAANLNRQMPTFLEGLKAALLPRTKRPLN